MKNTALVIFTREGRAMNVLNVIGLYYTEENEQKEKKEKVSEEAGVTAGNRLLLRSPSWP